MPRIRRPLHAPIKPIAVKPGPKPTSVRPSPAKTITIPHLYWPRSYQLPVWQARDEHRLSRFLTCWHRRSGKDVTWLNFTIRESQQRVGTYIHLYPQLKRARKALWDGRNREGMPFLDHFPPEIVKKKNETEMQIELTNKSIWQLEGMENINSVVGTNPVGVVFSEYSQMKPAVWDLIRPILAENGGWAAFNFTPRGRNHAFELYQMALQNPGWYTSLLTVEDTKRDAPGEQHEPIITPAMIEEERRSGMREAMVLQEYMCSFEAGSALQFIPPEYVAAAFARESIGWAWAPKIIGVDVGRNRDRAVILLRQGGIIHEKLIIHPHEMAYNPSEHIAGWVARLIEAHRPRTADAFGIATVFVDGVGVGVGVIDSLRRLGYAPIPVLGNSQSLDPAYYNLRAYMWGQAREWLRTEGCLQRGRDDGLAAELQWPQFRWKGDKEWLTPKDELEGESDTELEYASPDEADALCLTFAAPVTMQARSERRVATMAQVEYDPLTYDRPQRGRRVTVTDWNPLR